MVSLSRSETEQLTQDLRAEESIDQESAKTIALSCLEQVKEQLDLDYCWTNFVHLLELATLCVQKLVQIASVEDIVEVCDSTLALADHFNVPRLNVLAASSTSLIEDSISQKYADNGCECVVIGMLALILGQLFSNEHYHRFTDHSVRQRIASFAVLHFQKEEEKLLPPVMDQDIVLNPLNRQGQIQEDQVLILRFSALLQLLQGVACKRRSSWSIDSDAALRCMPHPAMDPNDAKIQTTLDDSRCLAIMFKVLENDNMCARRRSRIYKLLAVWFYNHTNSKLAEPTIPLLTRTLQRCEKELDTDELLNLASFVCNINYRQPDMQQLMHEWEVPHLLTTVVLAVRDPEPALAILRAYLHVNYDMETLLDAELISDMIEHVGHLCKQLDHVTSLAAIATTLLCKVDHTYMCNLISKLASGCYAQLAREGAKQNHITTGSHVENGALWPMSHASVRADRVAARAFAVTVADDNAHHDWVILYWIGRQDKEDKAPEIPQDILDELCLAGLNPTEALKRWENDSNLIYHEGVQEYVKQRYTHMFLVKKPKAIFDVAHLEYTAKRAFYNWASSQQEQPKEDDVRSWVETFIDSSCGLRHGQRIGGNATDAVIRARSSRMPKSFHVPGQTVSCIVAATDSELATQEAEEILSLGGLQPPLPGFKRWFHGCLGFKAISIVNTGSITNALCTSTNDFTRTAAFFFFETFERASSHACNRTIERNQALEDEVLAPAVLVVDLPEDVMEKLPHTILSTPDIARNHIFVARNPNLPKQYLGVDKSTLDKIAMALACPQAHNETDLSVMRFLLGKRMTALANTADNSNMWMFGYMAHGETQLFSRIKFWAEDEEEDQNEEEEDQDQSLLLPNLSLPSTKLWATTKLAKLSEGPALGQLAFINVNRWLTHDDDTVANKMVMSGIRAILFGREPRERDTTGRDNRRKDKRDLKRVKGKSKSKSKRR